MCSTQEEEIMAIVSEMNYCECDPPIAGRVRTCKKFVDVETVKRWAESIEAILTGHHETEGLGFIRIEPEPRYPEDGYINEEQDDNDNPKMPFMVADEKAQNGWVWKLDVNIKTGEVIGWPKEVKADVHYKVCDCCRIKYAGKEYYEYVPDFLAIDDEGYGDYIILTIEDGKIVNWSETDCREFIEKVDRKSVV